MAVRFLLDTNAAIHWLGGRVMPPYPEGEFGLSVISEIELLSYPRLADADVAAIERFLARVVRYPLTDTVRDRAIALRREGRLKVPDAIIAATALDWDATLLTHDERLQRVAGLRSRALSLRETSQP